MPGLSTMLKQIGHDYPDCSCPDEHPHTCPFRLEIEDDDSECNCCATCEQRCLEDI